VIPPKQIFISVGSGVTRERGQAPWGAGLGGAPAHFSQSFKNAF